MSISRMFYPNLAVILPLLLGASVAIAQQKATILNEGPVTTGLPSADEVLAKFEKFLGGKQALAKANSRTTWSRRVQETGAPDETYLLRRSRRDNRSIMKHINLDGTIHHWQNGCDGKAGWSAGGNGAEIRDANPNASAGPICHQDLYLYGYLPLDLDELKRSYKQIEVKAEITIVQHSGGVYTSLAGGKGKDLVPGGPRDAYLVLALPAREADTGTWLIFDKETGALLRRMHDNTPVPNAPAANAIFTDYLQYREVGDGTVASFHFITHNRNSVVHGVHTKIEDNLPLDDEIFRKPKVATREDKGL